MAHPDHNVVLRRRIEAGIGLVSPLLDLVLAVGERVSRLLGTEDPDYVPARIEREGESAPRGLPPRDHRARTG